MVPPPQGGTVSVSATSDVAKSTACVGDEPVDDQDVHGEHRDPPQRVRRHEVELADRVEPGYSDAEPACELATAEERERRDERERADDQRDPAPGVEAAEDEGLVPCVDPRVRDREDSGKDVERPRDP